MKKAVFFPQDKDSKKLSVVVVETDPQSLVGTTIPEGCKYVVMEFEEFKNLGEEDRLSYIHVDKAKFDNYKNPRKVVLDYQALAEEFLAKYRAIRSSALEKLDSLQVRAMLREKNDLVKEIESDKQLLRDSTKKALSRKFKSPSDFDNLVDDSALVDYEEKYSKRILE